ncbi:MAG: DNA adenine methylase [Chloroflexota bacterium]|nr:DNA adenine methylase [Chloroflexota bacterium]
MQYVYVHERRGFILSSAIIGTDLSLCKLSDKMRKITAYQQSFFPNITAKFPSTRYQGSKAKLVDWIWDKINNLDFSTCLDAFGGTGVVAYRLKQEGKQVIYNDILRFNYSFGKALIENRDIRVTQDEINWILDRHIDIHYPNFVEKTFPDIYFTDEENQWVDQTITNIRQLENSYTYSLAFFALSQACIIKRPFNLFHRKNLYMRFADVERSFGNKTTWDKPFDELFEQFLIEANRAVFDNNFENLALNLDANDIPGRYDLVYIDTPYISNKGSSTDYLDFYHFLEGLTIYDNWEKHINYKTKHRRLKKDNNRWTNKDQIHTAFNKLFKKFQDSILVVSYRSDGIPTEAELVELLQRYKSSVRVEYYGHYKYALSTNSKSKEILFIGE